MPRKKKITSDRVMLEFDTHEQAKAFFEYFKETGFDDFIMNDHVQMDLGVEAPECLSSEEEPNEHMDFYFFQLQ